MRRMLGVVCVTMLMTSVAVADSWQPSHSCRKPYKPFSFSNQWEVDSFNDDVRQYRKCIEEFIEEQQEAIDNHRQAAEEAIDDWESFVRLELR